MKVLKKYKCTKPFVIFSEHLVLKGDIVYGHPGDATIKDKTVLFNSKTQVVMGCIDNDMVNDCLQEQIETK